FELKFQDVAVTDRDRALGAEVSLERGESVTLGDVGSQAGDADAVFVDWRHELFITVDAGELLKRELGAVDDFRAALLDVVDEFFEKGFSLRAIDDLAPDVADAAEVVRIREPGGPGLSLSIVVDISGSLFWHVLCLRWSRNFRDTFRDIFTCYFEICESYRKLNSNA